MKRQLHHSHLGAIILGCKARGAGSSTACPDRDQVVLLCHSFVWGVGWALLDRLLKALEVKVWVLECTEIT